MYGAASPARPHAFVRGALPALLTLLAAAAEAATNGSLTVVITACNEDIAWAHHAASHANVSVCSKARSSEL